MHFHVVIFPYSVDLFTSKWPNNSNSQPLWNIFSQNTSRVSYRSGDILEHGIVDELYYFCMSLLIVSSGEDQKVSRLRFGRGHWGLLNVEGSSHSP